MFTRLSLSALLITVVTVVASMPTLLAAGHGVADVKDLKPYYQKEGLDLGQYDQVLIEQLGLDHARVVPPPWVQGAAASAEKWQLTNDDITWLRRSYLAAMQAEIGENEGYAIVDQPVKGVIILDVEIVSLMPYARKNENVQVRGFGEMLVNAELRDGASGELLAVYEGWQDVGSGYQQNTRLNAENDLRVLFAVWGQRVRNLLDSSR